MERRGTYGIYRIMKVEPVTLSKGPLELGRKCYFLHWNL